MSHWDSTSVIVTGGNGFLGRHIVKRLKAEGCENVFVPRREKYDLTTDMGVRRLFEDAPYDVVIHAAGEVGGIGKNRREPGEIFFKNLQMGSLVMEHARRNFVEKFVYVGSVCSYPEYGLPPFREDELWRGLPERTNRAYGMAKKAHLSQMEAYAIQYDFPGIYLVLANIYGPGDDFVSDDAHVIPSLIRKFSTQDKVALWGSGEPTRDFLYVEDAAEAIVKAARCYNDPDPVNIASGSPISIKSLASSIARRVGYEGAIEWDLSRPDGQSVRDFDTTRASREFGWTAKTPISVGLDKTIADYASSRVAHDVKNAEQNADD